MPKAQKFLANESGIHKRLFERRSRSSANFPTQPALYPFAQPDFFVVFEGCNGRAPHFAHADTAEFRSLWADILRTC